jgi:predicted TIM-barrel fold metal-dependent hydrolase
MLQWMISVDDHVIEPPGVWQDRIAAKDRDRAPRWIRDEDGEAWLYEDRRVPLSGMNAVAGIPQEQWSPLPLRLDDIRPGCYDPVARLEDMNADGVLAQGVFPSFPRFCGQTFLEAEDRDLARRCVQAYNDWMVEEWCGSAPGRFIPIVIVPLWDPPLAAAEVERCAAQGAKAVSFSENPYKLDLPSIHDAGNHWDPLLAAVEQTGMALSIHVGSSSTMPTTSPDCPVLASGTLLHFVAQQTMVDWLFSGKLLRFPNLKLILSEGGISWMPATLAVARYKMRKLSDPIRRTGEDFNQVLAGMTGKNEPKVRSALDAVFDFADFDPVELFHRNIFGCLIADQYGWGAVDELGTKNVMVETDFPHSDGSWPNSIAAMQSTISHLDQDAQYDILQGNARRVFKFTPASTPPDTPPTSSPLALS